MSVASFIDYEQLALAMAKLGMTSNLSQPLAVVPEGLNSSFKQSPGTAPEGLAIDSNQRAVAEPKKSEVKGGGCVVRGAGSVSVSSDWSDAVEEEETSGAFREEKTGPKTGVLIDVSDGSGSVDNGDTKFGGLGDLYGGIGAALHGEQKNVLVTSATLALRKLLTSIVGGKLPKRANYDLAVCVHTAGTMPATVKGGKVRLRALAAVGDAALTLHLVASEVGKGANVESAQALRSKLTSNVTLGPVCVGMGLTECIAYAPGVDVRTTKATPTAFEAVVGLLTLYRGPDVVRRFLVAAQLL